MTEFVILLPLFFILAFVSISLARLVYVRWVLEERVRFAAFSAAHGINADLLFQSHQAHRPQEALYMRNVNFAPKNTPFGDLSALISTSDIQQPEVGQVIPPASLLPRGRAGATQGRSNFWNRVYSGERNAASELAKLTYNLDYTTNFETRSLAEINPYAGTRSAIASFNVGMQMAKQNTQSSPATVLERDNLFQSRLLTSIKDDRTLRRDGFTLEKTLAPTKSFPGAFQGVMRNVLSADSGSIDSAIDNSVLHSQVTVSGMGSALEGLPLRGRADQDLTSELYILSDSWDINRQDGSNWRSLGSEDSTFHDSDDEGMLKRRTIGLWMLPSNLVALLEPMTDLFPSELRSTVTAMNGPISHGLTIIKEFFAGDNPLNKILEAIHSLPVIGQIVDIELPQWPAVRTSAYPGSTEMNGDKLTGKVRNFNDYVKEQDDFKDWER
jgi:hypothetical protein